MTEAISVVNLVKNYGTVKALDGLDLAVETGEVHGYLGPNGAGKTTTIRILNEQQLTRIARDYVTYYNEHQPHQGIDQYRPNGTAPPETDRAGELDVKSVLGGLHHIYERKRRLNTADGLSITTTRINAGSR